MKFLILFLFLIMRSAPLVSQNIQFKDLPEFFERGLEISGLEEYQSNYYLLSEECNKIFIVDNNSLEHQETIFIDGMNDGPISGSELESLAFYNDLLLISDEAFNKIYAFDLKSKSFKSINHSSYQDSLIGWNEDYGFEGLAVNTKQNLIYALREKNATATKSELVTFEIGRDTNNLIIFNFRDRIEIKLDTLWRHSGLYFDDLNNRLLAINSTIGDYKVVEISLDSLHQPNVWGTQNLVPGLKLEINDMDEIYHSNLEGIIMSGNELIIVSDNGSKGNNPCKEKQSKKTAFVKIRLNDK